MLIEDEVRVVVHSGVGPGPLGGAVRGGFDGGEPVLAGWPGALST